jgi:hypothetical protein
MLSGDLILDLLSLSWLGAGALSSFEDCLQVSLVNKIMGNPLLAPKSLQ